MNHIFVDPSACRHDGDRVRVVITVQDGHTTKTITFAEHLDATSAGQLVDVVRQHLTSAGGGR